MKPLHTALALTLAAALAACGADDPASLMTSARQYLDTRQFGAAPVDASDYAGRRIVGRVGGSWP